MHGVALPWFIINHKIYVGKIASLVCMFSIVILIERFKVWTVPYFSLILVGLGREKVH